MSAPPKQHPLPSPVRKRPPRARGDCATCYHVDRPVIEVGLAEGHSVPAMARRFGVSMFSLYRHRKNHMPPAVIQKILAGSGSAFVVENLEQLKTSEGEKLLSHVVEVRKRLYANAEAAERMGDFRAAALTYNSILRALELVGKLLDSFKGQQRTVVNQLIVSGDYLALRAALINALAPFPEARQAVARVLRELEVGSDGAGA